MDCCWAIVVDLVLCLYHEIVERASVRCGKSPSLAVVDLTWP